METRGGLLKGLVSRASLNGSEVIVTGWDAARARYAVRLPDGTGLLVKADNIVFHAAAAAASLAAAAPGTADASAGATSDSVSEPAAAPRLNVMWLKPDSDDVASLPALLPKLEALAILRPSTRAKLQQHLEAQHLVPFECRLPRAIGERLTLWHDPSETGTANVLATELTATVSATGRLRKETVRGLALVVRSNDAEGLPTADVMRSHADLVRLLLFLSDLLLPLELAEVHADAHEADAYQSGMKRTAPQGLAPPGGETVDLLDERVCGGLRRLWPAYRVGDTVRADRGQPVIEKRVGDGQSTALVTTTNIDDFLADPSGWTNVGGRMESRWSDGYP